MTKTKSTTVSGVWLIVCDCGGTTRCCSTCIVQLRSGETRSSVGQVRWLHKRPFATCLSNWNHFTDDKNDAFWLAQAYFMLQQYSRAERHLTRPFPDDEDDELERPITNGNSHPISAPLSTIPVPDSVRGKGRATDLFNLNSLPPFAAPHTQAHKTRLSLTGTDSRLPMGSSTAEDIVVEQQRPMSMLVDMSVACRYLAAQCQFRLGRWADAKEMLGESNPFRGTCE